MSCEAIERLINASMFVLFFIGIFIFAFFLGAKKTEQRGREDDNS